MHPHGFVKLIDVFGTDDKVAESARVSYNSGTKVRDNAKLVSYLIEHGHWSPLEQCSLTFCVSAPIFVARQWFRHRAGSFNEESARYSVIEEKFYVPDIRSQSTTNKQGSGGAIDSQLADKLKSTIESACAAAHLAYSELIAAGVSRELARVVLPVATYTKFYWTVNLRMCLDFIRQRTDPHAQQEIREYANVVAEYVAEKFPIAYAAFNKFTIQSAKLSSEEIEAVREKLPDLDFDTLGQRKSADLAAKLTKRNPTDRPAQSEK